MGKVRTPGLNRKKLLYDVAKTVIQMERSFMGLAQVLKRNSILLSIIQERLGITDAEIQEHAEKLQADADQNKTSIEGPSVQPEETGTDEDSSGSSGPEVLDSESDRESSTILNSQGDPPNQVDSAEHPAAGPSSDQVIIPKSPTMGWSEQEEKRTK